jgi:hypothetical protein
MSSAAGIAGIAAGDAPASIGDGIGLGDGTSGAAGSGSGLGDGLGELALVALLPFAKLSFACSNSLKTASSSSMAGSASPPGHTGHTA